MRKLFLILFVCSLLFPVINWAQYGAGDGTQSNPYQISTTDHLAAIATNVNGGNLYTNKYLNR
ncbi:MAG: hypothetical protein WC055_01400 [Melioribacteraceae bacterium]